MLKIAELENIIKNPLKKILDELNNHIDRDNYKELKETLQKVAVLIKQTIKQKGEAKDNG